MGWLRRKKRKKIPNQRMGESKKEGKKAPDQGSKENRRNRYKKCCYINVVCV